jgi:hypothetical protein
MVHGGNVELLIRSIGLYACDGVYESMTMVVMTYCAVQASIYDLYLFGSGTSFEMPLTIKLGPEGVDVGRFKDGEVGRQDLDRLYLLARRGRREICVQLRLVGCAGRFVVAGQVADHAVEGSVCVTDLDQEVVGPHLVVDVCWEVAERVLRFESGTCEFQGPADIDKSEGVRLRRRSSRWWGMAWFGRWRLSCR